MRTDRRGRRCFVYPWWSVWEEDDAGSSLSSLSRSIAKIKAVISFFLSRTRLWLLTVNTFAYYLCSLVASSQQSSTSSAFSTILLLFPSLLLLSPRLILQLHRCLRTDERVSSTRRFISQRQNVNLRSALLPHLLLLSSLSPSSFPVSPPAMSKQTILDLKKSLTIASSSTGNAQVRLSLSEEGLILNARLWDGEDVRRGGMGRKGSRRALKGPERVVGAGEARGREGEQVARGGGGPTSIDSYGVSATRSGVQRGR